MEKKAKLALVGNTVLDPRNYNSYDDRKKAQAVSMHWLRNILFEELDRIGLEYDYHLHFNYDNQNDNIDELSKQLIDGLNAKTHESITTSELEDFFLKEYGIDTSLLYGRTFDFWRGTLQYYFFVKTSYKLAMQDESYTHFMRVRPDTVWTTLSDGVPGMKELINGFKWILTSGREISRAKIIVPSIQIVPTDIETKNVFIEDRVYLAEREAIIRMHDVLEPWVMEWWNEHLAAVNRHRSDESYEFIDDFIYRGCVYSETNFARLLMKAKIFAVPMFRMGERILIIRQPWLDNATEDELKDMSNLGLEEMHSWIKSIGSSG